MCNFSYCVEIDKYENALEKNDIKYHSFLYCHTMMDENHLLKRTVPTYIKSLSRHPLCNLEHVVGAIQFEIGTKMFYVF